MKINRIITQRDYNIAAPFKIVYEWEDILSEKSNIPLYKETSFHFHKIYCSYTGSTIFCHLILRNKKAAYC